jgi:streptogramin lyase
LPEYAEAAEIFKQKGWETKDLDKAIGEKIDQGAVNNVSAKGTSLGYYDLTMGEKTYEVWVYPYRATGYKDELSKILGRDPKEGDVACYNGRCYIYGWAFE